MATKIDPEFASWAVGQLAPGGTFVGARGLRAGGAPWLVTARTQAGNELEGVLRVGPVGDTEDIRVEAASLRYVSSKGLPAPVVLGMRASTDPALLLIERVSGRSDIPLERPTGRLRTLGAFAARLSQLDAPAGFPPRTRSIAGVDFDALRREAEPQPLLQQAEAIVAAGVPEGRVGVVHGDLWQGNALWDDDELVAVIDWDCSGVGPAGIDLGSLRMDAALCFGGGAEADVLDGWRGAAGVPSDLAYWDLTAALSTPPTLAWFVEATRAQGRPDLNRPLMLARRDEFLRAALDAV
jgi:aminoglycoside phosphotransferase (APT) family kinase protein